MVRDAVLVRRMASAAAARPATTPGPAGRTDKPAVCVSIVRAEGASFLLTHSPMLCVSIVRTEDASFLLTHSDHRARAFGSLVCKEMSKARKGDGHVQVPL